MKAHASCLLLHLAAGIPTLLAQNDLPSQLHLSLTTGTADCQLSFDDPSNGTWILQSSANLSRWEDLTTFKVHNSTYIHWRQAPPNQPGLFFRMQRSAAAVGNGTADALHLVPGTDFVTLHLPAHLLTPQIVGQDNTPLTNPLTNTGAELGRVLFYDKRLSANNTVSCASCHKPQHGFSDPRPLSIGFQGGLTGRNSMGLTSARYYPRRAFFWDERAATLEDQVLMPIQDPTEMGMTLPALVTKLSTETFYAELFTSAFGDPTITSDRLSRALAQFIRSIVSTTTPFDVGRAASPQFSNFTAQQEQGRQLFIGRGRCDSCHGTDNFVPNNLFNNGLEFPYLDLGVGGITNRTQDEGKFKVPTLRNIELTAPYMHDGRFATLEQVVDFYNAEVVPNPNLSPPLRLPGGGPVQALRLNLNAQERAALVAFLKTLTDTTVTTNPKFQDPFRYDDLP